MTTPLVNSSIAPPQVYQVTPRQRVAGWVSQGAQSVNVPKGIPQFLGNNSTIVLAWVIAIVIISVDEWRKNKILPRPSRLWYTTLVYGILCLMGMVPALVPIATALALGYSIVLAWQYFNGAGQFSE